MVHLALKVHIDLVKFIQDDTGFSNGPPLQILVKSYKNQAKKDNPDMDVISLANAAKTNYLKDNRNNVIKKYNQAVKNYAASRNNLILPKFFETHKNQHIDTENPETKFEQVAGRGIKVDKKKD
jgi:hypothetical protein